MTPQIEKVIPAGTNRLGYMSESSPVLKPFIGSALASAFTVKTAANATKLKIESWSEDIFFGSGACKLAQKKNLVFMIRFALSLATIFSLCFMVSCASEAEPAAPLLEAPEQLTEIIDQYVDNGGFPFLYLRLEDLAGEVLFEHGRENNSLHPGLEVDGNSMIRIWSMSKIVTISMALDLIEEGIIQFEDPVVKFIPEFENLEVAVDVNGISLVHDTAACSDRRVPVDNPMTVLHLLDHQAGFYYATTSKDCINDGLAATNVAVAENTDDAIKKLATLPLIMQPGEADHYGMNTTVLGFVMERATGKTLEQLLEEKIRSAFGIEDFTYYKPEELKLIPAVTGRDSILRYAKEGELDIFGPYVPDYSGPLCLGGESMLASADAYCDFLRILLGYGTLDGKELLEEPTVDDLIAPHSQLDNPWGHNGYNLWITSDTLEEVGWGIEGLWQGGGYEGTQFWVDREHGFVAVLMSQINATPAAGWDMYNELRGAIYTQLKDEED